MQEEQIASIALGVIGLLGATVTIVAVVATRQRRRLVEETSAALAEVRRLNHNFQNHLVYPHPIAYLWEEWVDSKAKLDRFDFHAYFLDRIATLESSIDLQIQAHVRDMEAYSAYWSTYLAIGRTLDGPTGGDVRYRSFRKTERELFANSKLRPPLCAAHVRCVVRYTSPRGQNSYTRWKDWDFEQLRDGLAEMRRSREARSTAKFLQQQERNRITPGIRYKILARDRFRCQGCGATSSIDGVVLHVDHIIPISRGGRSDADNLQTLCQTCNLGKGDRH